MLAFISTSHSLSNTTQASVFSAQLNRLSLGQKMKGSGSRGKILYNAGNTRNTLASASSATEIMGKIYSVPLMNLSFSYWKKKLRVLKQNFCQAK